MNISYFISRRIRKASPGSFSATIHNVALASIGLGLAVMIISFLILEGFKSNIQDKVYSFGGHLQMTKYTLSSGYDEDPIIIRSGLKDSLLNLDYVKNIQAFSFKAGLLQTKETVQGIVFKGVDSDYDSIAFATNMTEGHFISFPEEGNSNEIIISNKLSNLLKLQIGDQILIHFIQNPPRHRKLTVAGFYDTGMETLDEKLIIGDINLIRKLNNWEPEMTGGYEIFLNDADDTPLAYEELFESIDYDLYIEKTSDKYFELFDWLKLINRNVYIFLVIILFVACINMSSVLLILIMERIKTIGLLKALGATNKQIRSIFIYSGFWLIIRGLFWGNLIGIGFGGIQSTFRLIKLDAESYYMHFVPITWDFQTIILLNLLTFSIIGLVLLLPASFIANIKPVKTIRFS